MAGRADGIGDAIRRSMDDLGPALKSVRDVPVNLKHKQRENQDGVEDLETLRASEGGANTAGAPSASSIEGTIDRLRDGSEPLSNKNGLRQYERSGGYDQAQADFAELTRGLGVEEKPNGTKVAKLPDGTTANVRSKSSGGLPTLELNRPSGTANIKIRYT